MPPKRYYKKRGRRNYKRKRKYYRPTVVKLRGNQIVPDALLKEFKFGQTMRMDSGVTGLNYRAFKANDLFDIDYTVSGTADAGGVTVMDSLYKTYVVNAASIKCEIFQNATSPGNGNIDFFLYPNNVPITSSIDFGDLMSGLYVKRVNLAPIGSGKTIATVKHYMTTKKMFATSNLDAYLYEGTLDGTTSPLSPFYWNMQVSPVTAGNQPDVTVRVEVTFYCKLTESKSQIQA